MRHFKIYLERGWRLAVLITLLAFSPLANLQSAAAQSSSPAVGVACTTGASPNPTFNLAAQAGYIQMPDMNTMYMWSYSLAGGAFQHPGPILCVNQGDTVTITLQNQIPNYRGIPVRTSIMFPGQENVTGRMVLLRNPTWRTTR